ncbi:RluA family pseudouridine synthase [Ferrovum sp. PN-J185]|uniref:RluA family pseudouridine synthase n=1 Tax=Ferrovum sp. PN-J185 TaxID=1356306 RepID=UPI001E514076|nr:RluA family pseudouridine synthase [Ferrovum sp. PN-J185]MCC6067705.1 RluA family pseudouridine synthase [Ferrovum sp. PN-J185]
MHALSKKSVEIKIADESVEGQRVDNFLLNYLKGVPKSHIYRIIRSGEVRVNSKRVNQTYRLELNDQVRIPPISSKEKTVNKHNIKTNISSKISIVYEDEFTLVVDKPSGLAVHGGSGISMGLIESLRIDKPDYKFLELVHRLDRDTSGLLIIAKKRSFLTKMHEIIRAGKITKKYITFVKGFTKNQQTIKLALLKTENSHGERQVKVNKDGQQAITKIETISHYNEGSLLKVNLITGRTHQIRVHLSHIGHPLAGDDKYGDFSWNREMHQRFSLKRLFLHAALLEFIHPITNEKVTLDAPLPKELTQFLQKLTVLS